MSLYAFIIFSNREIIRRCERMEIHHWTPDYLGREIIVTPGRLNHIHEFHPFMVGHINLIGQTLSEPDEVRESSAAPTVHLFYRWYTNLSIGDQFICVVLKVNPFMGTVITAYPTDRIKRGELVWKREL